MVVSLGVYSDVMNNVDCRDASGRKSFGRACRSKADRVFGIGKGGVYPSVERTVLITIPAAAAKRSLFADEKLIAFVELEASVTAFRRAR
jgi:hypothetical protein